MDKGQRQMTGCKEPEDDKEGDGDWSGVSQSSRRGEGDGYFQVNLNAIKIIVRRRFPFGGARQIPSDMGVEKLGKDLHPKS
jgi:hypothetical protein